MVDQKDVYRKYSNILFIRLERFVLKNQDVFESNNPSRKLEFLEEIKRQMDKSAVIKGNVPDKYVPAKKIYQKLYDLLFTSSLLRKSYLKALKKRNRKKIAKLEEEIFSYLDSALEGFHFKPETIKDKTLRRYCSKLVDKTLSSIKQKSRSMKSFRRLVYILIMVLAVGAITPSFASAANMPYQTDNQKKEYVIKMVEPAMQELVKVDLTMKENFETTKDVDKLADYFVNSKDAQHRKLIADGVQTWLEKNDVINYKFWADSLLNHSVKEGGRRLQKYVQQKVGSNYEVKFYHQKIVENDTSIVHEQGFISIDSKLVSQLVDYVNIAEQNDVVDSLSNSQSKSMNIVKIIKCGINNDGNLVFSIVMSQGHSQSSDFQSMEEVLLVIVPAN
mgnify:CR=1 FL=1